MLGMKVQPQVGEVMGLGQRTVEGSSECWVKPLFFTFRQGCFDALDTDV